MARYVRVTSISFAGTSGTENHVQRAVEEAAKMLEQAALDKPDICCLPETFTGIGLSSEDWFRTAEPVPGPTTESLGTIAKKHSMYIICPIVHKKGKKVYNSAVLIDRQGKIVGAYHKIHPTIGEIETGITPGTRATVLKTDFGKIGFAICYDLNFRDVVEGAKANGAEIIFFPSMYRGGLQLSIWAFDFSLYVVSATPGELSAIVDPLGRVIAKSWNYSPIISRVLNLDCKVLHIDYNNAQWNAIKQKYGPGVEIDIEAPEAVFLLKSNLLDRTVDDIIREFNLETRQDYFQRANLVRQKTLALAK